MAASNKRKQFVQPHIWNVCCAVHAATLGRACAACAHLPPSRTDGRDGPIGRSGRCFGRPSFGSDGCAGSFVDAAARAVREQPVSARAAAERTCGRFAVAFSSAANPHLPQEAYLEGCGL